MDKLLDTRRLQVAKLGHIAVMLSDTLRREYKSQGVERGLAVDKAREDAWTLLRPPLESIEALKDELKQAKEEAKQVKHYLGIAFEGYAGELDDIIDPEYQEADAGKRLRDAFVWVGDEFRRITVDSLDDCRPPGTVTVMDFSKATTRPPTVLAVQIAEEYGRCSPGSRRDLFSKLISFSVKSHTPKEDSEQADTSEADACLAALKEKPTS